MIQQENTATAEQVTASVAYLPKEMSFFFRTKQVINELGEKIEVKRPTVKLNIPIVTLDGVVGLINAGNPTIIAGLLSVLEDVVYKAAKEQVDEDEAITQEKLDLAKLTLDYILALPPSSRASIAPSDEQWKLFEQDYPAVMSAVQPDRTAEQIATARDILMKKLTPVKDKPAIIKVLQGYVSLWFTSTSKQEELLTVFEYLNQRAENLLAAPVKVLDLSAI